MRRNQNIGFNSLSVKDCQQLAVYFYNFMDGHEYDMDEHAEVQGLFMNLIKRLNKTERAHKIAELFIRKMIKDGRLHKKAASKTYENPFDMCEKLSVDYKEDIDIAREYGAWTSDSEFTVNLCRILGAGPADAFTKMIYMILLSSKEYQSVPEEIKVSQGFKKLESDYSTVSFLKDALELNENEAKYLQAVYRYCTVGVLRRAICTFCEEHYNACGELCGLDDDKVKKILRNGEKLISFGFIDRDADMPSDVISTIRDQNLDTYFSDILKTVNVDEAYDIDSFAVADKAEEVTASLLNGNKSVNILLYGKPGSGKTEFAKSLAKQSGLEVYIYKNESEIDDENHNAQMHAIGRLNCLLAIKKENSVIIVDEAESVLETVCQSFFGSMSLPQKGTINKMLEASRNKTIWILNYTNNLDESTKRRFTYSIKFNEMPTSTLQSIARTKLSKVEMNARLRSKILELCGKYRVTGASIENIVKAVECMNPKNNRSEDSENPECSKQKVENKKVLESVKEILEANSALLYGNAKTKMRDKVSDSYDSSVLNTTFSAEKIVKMIQNALKFGEKEKSSKNGIRMLFYGLSGTGKTEFARYIADRLGKKILLKRCSDILGKYVGESEQNIRDAFEEAEESGSILLFDEADSFFADRTNARQSWERTQVNEFLTQMEEFSGILICTTNLKKIMDPAMNRRFHIITEFKPLASSGIEKLLKKYFWTYSFTEKQISRLEAYDSVTPGDFGVLFNKIRFMDKEDVTSDSIISELTAIQEEKNSGQHKAVGFTA